MLTTSSISCILKNIILKNTIFLSVFHTVKPKQTMQHTKTYYLLLLLNNGCISKSNSCVNIVLHVKKYLKKYIFVDFYMTQPIIFKNIQRTLLKYEKVGSIFLM